jgi:peptide/nickel transport system permease protein
MSQYLVRRALLSLLVLWGAVTVVFVAVRLVPGDPAQVMLGTTATAEQIAALRTRLGLDRPVPIQYGTYLLQVVHLDLGDSLRLGTPVIVAVADRAPKTLLLGGVALGIAVLLGFPMGLSAAVNAGKSADRVISLFSILGQSVPGFWVGIMLILVFARELRLLPSGGADTWQHLVLPAATLALHPVGILARLVRSGLLEVVHEDYVRTAYAKGLATRSVVLRHAVPNMLIPVVTVVGLQAGNLLGGAVIVESVFAWPGVGRLLVDAIGDRDYPLVEAATLFITGAFVLINLLVDVLYGYLDPRIRLA